MLTDEQKQCVRVRLNQAVSDGRVLKPDNCSKCGDSDRRIIGHHKDYNKPFDVEWLCDRCHKGNRHKRSSKRKYKRQQRIRIKHKYQFLPVLEDVPFVNRGLLTEHAVIDERKYPDEVINWGKRLDCLTYRQREVIKLRYGLDDGYTYTLEEVARIFRVTRARVGQIEKMALGRLKRLVA